MFEFDVAVFRMGTGELPGVRTAHKAGLLV